MDLDQFIYVDGACAVGAVCVFIPAKEEFSIAAHILPIWMSSCTFQGNFYVF